MNNYILLGLGTTGKATASWCHRKGFSAYIVDDAKEAAVAFVEKEKLFLPVMTSVEFCSCIDKLPLKNSIAVTSPGFPYQNSAFKKVEELKIPIVSEVELALRLVKNIPPLIAVTGTNGKTTVVELITHIINASGKKAKAIGNIGTPLIEAFTEESFPDWFVVELSSFQLALTFSRRFSIGCWLNISPNHLDWHSSMEEYVDAKVKLYSLTLQDGFFFMHDTIQYALPGVGARVIRYGEQEKSSLHIVQGKIAFDKEEGILPKELLCAPEHDRDNFLAAYGVARTLGIASKTIHDAYASFKKPSHRIEFVQKIRNITYIDDSKSSNVASTEAAISSCDAPIVLIAGGVHKGSPYSSWGSFSDKVKAIVAIGQAKEKIAHDVGDKIPVTFAPSLEEAVKIASKLNPSGTVLLSPGCSSFDMFHDYKDRGRQFKEIVRSLNSSV
jgi:UDP-N-acetylmuramoylalanine--D-glutamate ligase